MAILRLAVVFISMVNLFSRKQSCCESFLFFGLMLSRCVVSAINYVPYSSVLVFVGIARPVLFVQPAPVLSRFSIPWLR